MEDKPPPKRVRFAMPIVDVRDESDVERTVVPMEVEPQCSGAVARADEGMGVGEEGTGGAARRRVVLRPVSRVVTRWGWWSRWRSIP